MTGPGKHCTVSTLSTPAIMHRGLLPSLETGQWGLQTFPQLMGNKHFDCRQVDQPTLKTTKVLQDFTFNHGTRCRCQWPRWAHLQPSPTLMFAGEFMFPNVLQPDIFILLRSLLVENYFQMIGWEWSRDQDTGLWLAPQPSGRELLSNDLPGHTSQAGLRGAPSGSVSLTRLETGRLLGVSTTFD